MFERHNGMQTPHKSNAQHGIRKTAANDGDAQQIDGDGSVYKKIKTSGIECKHKERQGYEAVNISAHESEPSQAKQTPHPNAK